MKAKPVLLLMLLVAVPLMLLAWLGMRIAASDRDLLQQRTRELLTDRLQDIDQSIAGQLTTLARDLETITTLDSFSPEKLREIIRQDPRILQLFVIRPDDVLLHPNPGAPLNRSEEEFLSTASQIIIDRDLQRSADGASEAPSVTAAQKTNTAPGRKLDRGWFTWYWGRGLNLVYWQRRPSGHIVGVALDRSRWIADLIAALPDTPQADSDGTAEAAAFRIRLIDSTSQPAYQWGHFEAANNDEPVCEIPLSAPLSAWRLQQFIPADRLVAGTGSSALFGIGSGMLAAALGLVAIALFLYREYARDMREAGQRVSFVNQVSHELRTPLTNIRLYADLLETDLDALPPHESEQPRQRLRVIRSEGQRLHRLIGNVLAFARQQREMLSVHPQPGRVDTIIRDFLDRMRPVFARQGITMELGGQAAREVLIDADALEGMLDNLLSNVEKYAADGGWVGITLCQEEDRTDITVADRGPGLDQHARQHVFEPFWRGSDQLTHAAGTGIGLSIARELARLHGGDLTLEPGNDGAVFHIELSTPAPQRSPAP